MPANALKRKFRKNNYTQEELTAIAEAFRTHESVCYPPEQARLTFLLKRLCEGLTELAVLPGTCILPAKRSLCRNAY